MLRKERKGEKERRRRWRIFWYYLISNHSRDAHCFRAHKRRNGVGIVGYMPLLALRPNWQKDTITSQMCAFSSSQTKRAQYIATFKRNENNSFEVCVLFSHLLGRYFLWQDEKEMNKDSEW